MGKLSPLVPASAKHILALKIAQRLHDLENLTRYLVLSEHYPKELLLKAYFQGRHSESPSNAFFAFFNN